jgi:DNA topoisomerase VI subunit A
MRFANRVPLLYQPSACAITKSLIGTDWRNYKLSQSLKMIALSKNLIETDDIATKREAYYVAKGWDDKPCQVWR